MTFSELFFMESSAPVIHTQFPISSSSRIPLYSITASLEPQRSPCKLSLKFQEENYPISFGESKEQKDINGRITWPNIFIIPFVFDGKQQLHFRITILQEHWEGQTNLRELSEAGNKELQLSSSKGTKKLNIICQPYIETGYFLLGRLIRSKLGNPLKFSIGMIADPIYESEVSRNEWDPFEISLPFFESLNENVKLCFSKDGREVFSVTQTLNDLLRTIGKPLTSGRAESIAFDDLRLTIKPTFDNLVYEPNPIGITTAFAINFSRSNGSWTDSNSLHFLSGKNPYRECIATIGNILKIEESPVAVMGFGIEHQGGPTGRTLNRDCFSLTLNESARLVSGTKGVLRCYEWAIRRLKDNEFVGSSTTTWEEVIRTAAENAEQAYWIRQTYSVLVLITDGPLGFWDRTLKEIVDASRLPISIICVVVGSCQEPAYEKIEELDTEKQMIKFNDDLTVRDIVTCVRMRGYQMQKRNLELAARLIRRIREQFMAWASFVGLV
jgi:hypothetical protein